jgi:hypothetical protein
VTVTGVVDVVALGLCPASPAYCAARACVPTVRFETTICAAPDDSTACPMLTESEVKVTVPVALDAVTVARMVTAVPVGPDAGVAVSAVVVSTGGAAEVTVTERGALTLAVSASSPEYDATTEWPPTESDEVDTEAAPPTTSTTPIVAEPSVNVTTPVAADGATVAVNVTGCPTGAELAEAASVVVVEAGAGPTVIVTAGDVLGWTHTGPSSAE